MCCCHILVTPLISYVTLLSLWHPEQIRHFYIPDAEAMKLTGLGYNKVSGDIYLDEVNCTGEESQLLECRHNGIGVHDCSHYQDAGVRCTGKSQSSDSVANAPLLVTHNI